MSWWEYLSDELFGGWYSQKGKRISMKKFHRKFFQRNFNIHMDNNGRWPRIAAMPYKSIFGCLKRAKLLTFSYKIET